jgi:hypothetical protein
MAGKEAVKARSGGTQKKAEAPIRDPGLLFRRLGGGSLRTGGLRRHHLPGLLFAEVHLGVNLMGVGQHLLDQRLVVVGHQAVSARAMQLSHLILLPLCVRVYTPAQT